MAMSEDDRHMVADVVEGGPACGQLRRGDELLTVDGRDVTVRESLLHALGDSQSD